MTNKGQGELQIVVMNKGACVIANAIAAAISKYRGLSTALRFGRDDERWWRVDGRAFVVIDGRAFVVIDGRALVVIERRAWVVVGRMGVGRWMGVGLVG